IGPNKEVANVVVFLKAPLGSAFKLPDADALKKLPTEADIDQPHCAFLPHVQALYAPHQKLKIVNNANVAHNTKVEGMSGKNGVQNFTLQAKTNKVLQLDPQPIPLNVSCQIHPWMNGIVWAFNHPFFGVSKGGGPKDTNADFGTYEIQNVPAGIEVS